MNTETIYFEKFWLQKFLILLLLFSPLGEYAAEKVPEEKNGKAEKLKVPENLVGTYANVLVITGNTNPYSKYMGEILTAEGMNDFDLLDITKVSQEILAAYDMILLGEISLTSLQVEILSNRVQQGATLIAFRPDIKLAPLLGLSPLGTTLSDKYLLLNPTGPGEGLVRETIQFHGAADLYELNGAISLALLYSDAFTATSYPAVSENVVGNYGGRAIAFTYDLARSVVYTRQGNPAWAGQERDNQPGPRRSNDMFYPDWVDLNKVAIPQADEQQRLLANIIIQNNRHPAPRFWYMPRGLKAAVVMTGDDHANGGTIARFNRYLELSSDNSPEAVAEWRAIRGSSYIFPNTPISNAQAKAFEEQGFEIALHLNTQCKSYTAVSIENDLTTQLAEMSINFPDLDASTTNRTHCIAFSDWATQPKAELVKGIRLDANYYYWPGAWINDRPGMFTGSGIPMKFADLDGTTIDVYQLNTQMTDESGQSFPYTIDQLLDKALGPEGYYGIFCANMHTDDDYSEGSEQIIASAMSRNIPVITAKQVLTWMDGRNTSSYRVNEWKDQVLDFSLTVAPGAHKLETMLPATFDTLRVVSLTQGETAVNYRTEKIKGVEYILFQAATGNFFATYGTNEIPVVTIGSPTNPTTYGTSESVTIEVDAADLDGNITKVEFFQGFTKLGEVTEAPYQFTWESIPSGSFSLTARATDDKGAIAISEPVVIEVSQHCPCSVFAPEEKPSGTLLSGDPLQLGMKFRSSEDGFITGVRFYKQTGNNGVHTGQLYSREGNLLAEAVFTNETASDWQEVSFASPVLVTANTTYVISYHSNNGFYSAGTPSFGNSLENGVLTGLQSGTDGANGVYLYSTNPSFPTQHYQSSNYWVDVVFDTTALVNLPPVVSLTSPAEGSNYEAPATIQLIASASDTDGSIAKVEFFQGDTLLAEDTSSPYTFDWINVAAGNYSITVKATDDKGRETMSAEVLVSVTPDPTSFACPCTVFNAEDTPTGGFYGGAPLQLGMKFRSSADGYVTGVRFYKETGNTGVHTGQLYSRNGNLLAEAVFTSETASGWQEVSFASPVPVTANTTYVISYHSTNGFYSASNFSFGNSFENSPLTGLQSGTDGNNGLYKYSGAPTFPELSYQSSNYWVDVVFDTVPFSENQKPQVSLISPTENDTFTVPSTINLQTATSDPDGTLSKVEFFAGTEKLGEVLSSPFNIDWTVTKGGAYMLTARATDNEGATATSSGINILVSDPQNQPPTIYITSPENGISIPAGGDLTIVAEASDVNGDIYKVEFFRDNQKLGEDLVSPFTYYWNNIPAGSHSITARATDDEGATTTSPIVLLQVEDLGSECPCTVFEPGDAPSSPLWNDGVGLQVGMKFQALEDGVILGARFFKQSGTTGTHTAQLYSRSGNLLAESTFQNETASGWQEVYFTSPIPITANTTYVISYHSSNGYYSSDNPYFNTPVINGSLVGLQSGADGPNGVYRYSSTPTFPNLNFQTSNYWVDVIFDIPQAIKNSMDLTSETKPNSGENINSVENELKIFPNPFEDIATLIFVPEDEGAYIVRLYDSKGTFLRIIEQGKSLPGFEKQVVINGEGLPEGIYLVQLQNSQSLQMFRLVLNRKM